MFEFALDRLANRMRERLALEFFEPANRSIRPLVLDVERHKGLTA
jgi:hypothetical protein